MLSSRTLEKVQEDRGVFTSQSPYPHVCIDGFLQQSVLSGLNQSFPLDTDADYKKYCIEDGGKPGSNYANPDPASFPEPFQKLDKYFGSGEFLRYLESLTGIDGLLYDPEYQGGGLRESRNRGFLPVHLDFNRHPKTGLHRRLNLLLYLNENWQEGWGGDIQVHRDPRESGADSLVRGYSPINNRCFIFETSEHSWHGFSQLHCPIDRGRRAVSIYYFTKTRPEGEVPFRNTEYVEPPLPRHIQTGTVLTQEDAQLILDLLKRRDDRIQMLYELRRTFDGKYTHLWSEYEYYLDKFRQANNTNHAVGTAATGDGAPAPANRPLLRRIASRVRQVFR